MSSSKKRSKTTDDGASVDPRLMKALSHPLRQRILQVLNQRVASPAELSVELGESLGNVSYHVKILAELETIELVRTAPVRGALEHFYRPLVGSYFNQEDWLSLPDSIRKEIFGQTLEQTCEALARAVDDDKVDGSNESMVRMDLDLDDQGLAELAAVYDEVLERVTAIQSAAVERMSALSDDERAVAERNTQLALMHFSRAARERAKA